MWGCGTIQKHHERRGIEPGTEDMTNACDRLRETVAWKTVKTSRTVPTTVNPSESDSMQILPSVPP